MTLEAPIRCSALAEQLDEPMIGTVDVRRRWLLLEDRSAWGSHAVRDLFGAEVEARAKELALRLLLVRRREGDPSDDVVRRALLVDTVTGEVAQRTIGRPADLGVDALATIPIATFGELVTGPQFLVCTNGKRDACCALRGRILATALADAYPDRVWESTHLGGHRFAANLVCLPHGILYGRLTADDGLRVAAAYLDGRVEPDALRGRSAWPAPAQVAEGELRTRLGLAGIDDVALVAVDAAGDRATVTLAAAGEEHRFSLVAERLSPPRPTSCRGDELEEPLHWRLV